MRHRTPGDGPKCHCGAPAVWGGFCQMEDGRGFCSRGAAAPAFDPTRCAVHTWFRPEPGQPCCFCEGAAKADADPTVRLVSRDLECYQAGWAAAMARVSEFPPGSRWQHREDSAVVVKIEKVDGANVHWLGELFAIRNFLSFDQFVERFEPVAPLPDPTTGVTQGLKEGP